MIAAIIGPVATLLSDVIRRAFPDKTEAARIEAALTTELLKADMSAITAQLQVNAEEAKHESIFVAGWRPFIGWVCGSALAYRFIVQPFVAFGLGAAGVDLPPLPTIDDGALTPILSGMLGLGAMRTFEKVQGANKRR